MFGHKERGSGHRKCNQHDRSDDISHTTYYFKHCKSIAQVVANKLVFYGLPISKIRLWNHDRHYG